MASLAPAADGLASLLATIQRLYPQARVTSGYRGPNNPLTQAHPASLHAQGSPEDPRAVDIAPIPGMSFDQYASSVRNAGVPLSQQFDEAAHPFPWTTGPNWHLAAGQAPVQPYYTPQKKPTLAQMAQPDMTAQITLDSASPDTLSAPQTLGQLALPDKIKKPSPFTAANILGVLGDALMAYGGLPPQFAPRMAKQQEDDQQAGLARERLNAEVQAAQAKANESPQFVQNAQAWAGLGPDQRRLVLEQQDAVNPINVSTPQGTQNVPRIQHKQINGKSYYGINGEWYEEGE